MQEARKALQEALRNDSATLVNEWLAALGQKSTGASANSTAAEAQAVLAALAQALEGGMQASFSSEAWAGLREVLEQLSASRAAQGQTTGDTSAFVLALKGPLFAALQRRAGGSGEALVNTIIGVGNDVDAMAQWTVDTFQRARETIISRQQEELLELSTPVIKLWDGILAVPMIGTLDSTRTQLVMEALLQRIVETESTLAIIDITGVPTVDTLVAQHLLKTVAAIRLLGADCIISGIRPQIAQTVVHLGIDLQSVSSKSTLAGALALALKQAGYVVTRKKSKD